MKNKYIKSFLTLFTIVFFQYGCNSSDEGDARIIRTEIVDEAILTADVDAAGYWDNTELVWNDEFDGNGLSFENWLFEDNSIVPSDTEWQKYTKNDNYEVSNGTLKIYAKKTGDGQKKGDYTSARLGSKFAFTYGQMEIRAKISEHKGNGIWTKLWLLGNAIQTTSWPEAGEIDIMEYYSLAPDQIQHTVHSGANNQKKGTLATSGRLNLETVTEEFHNYGLLWSPKYLKFYVDTVDNVLYTFNAPATKNASNWPFSKPFYFLMNIVVGGKIAGSAGVEDSIFPVAMEIDYVRVYHAKPSG